jgi:hypothetical protein
MNTFVANKPTSIQVVMTEPYDFTSSDTVIIYRDGAEIAEVKPDRSENTQIMTFTPPKSAVDSWPAGRYSFTAQVGGSEHTTEAIFNESKPFSVLVVGASVKYDGVIYDAPPMNAETVTLRAQALPVSENKLTRRFIAAPISFGTGANGYDLAQSSSALRFLEDIENYRLKSAANYDAVAVVVDSYISDSQSTGGYTNSNHALVLSLKALGDSESITSSFLHELGHIFGNGDEYEGGQAKPDVNGLPYNVSATDSYGNSIVGTREYFLHAPDNTYSGILLDDAQNPFNPKSGGVMMDTSSFMGSSYIHWTTSMVWEEAYEKLIPNYLNVLPKVYTDGTLVPERNLENTLNEEQIQELRDAWYAMCGEVRAEKGLAPYSFDEYHVAGEKYYQKLAEDTMKKGETEILFDIGDAFRPMGFYALERSSNAYIYEWTDSELEDFRSFFTLSDCGIAAIRDEYMNIAFMEVGGRLFFTWTTYDTILPLPDTSEPVEPQPETQPELEVNPADNELPTDHEAWSDPAENGGEEWDDPAEDTDWLAGLPAFEAYTPEMVEDMMYYDSLDYSVSEESGMSTQDPYMRWGAASAYLGWWAGEKFYTELTAEEVNAVYTSYMTYKHDGGLEFVTEMLAEHFSKTFYSDNGNSFDPYGEPIDLAASDPGTPGSDPGTPGSDPGTPGLPAFEDYTKEMRDAMYTYDVFSIGMAEAGLYDDRPYMAWDIASAYLGWWAGQNYGTELTSDEVKALLEAAQEASYANGGAGDVGSIAGVIAEYFGGSLYGDGGYVNPDGTPYVFGDGDVSDPDGEW